MFQVHQVRQDNRLQDKLLKYEIQTHLSVRIWGSGAVPARTVCRAESTVLLSVASHCSLFIDVAGSCQACLQHPAGCLMLNCETGPVGSFTSQFSSSSARILRMHRNCFHSSALAVSCSAARKQVTQASHRGGIRTIACAPASRVLDCCGHNYGCTCRYASVAAIYPL